MDHLQCLVVNMGEAWMVGKLFERIAFSMIRILQRICAWDDPLALVKLID